MESLIIGSDIGLFPIVYQHIIDDLLIRGISKKMQTIWDVKLQYVVFIMKSYFVLTYVMD